MPEPYFHDGTVSLYLGDCREVLPALGVTADLIVADPPYAETSLAWDRWPDGWLQIAAAVSSSLWCFGSMRMFLDRRDEFAAWKLSQDVIWEKHNGSGFHSDRFKRVHEAVTHWYRGEWSAVHHATPRIHTGVDPRSRSVVAPADRGAHLGAVRGPATWADDGTRLVRSVLRVRSMHRNGGIHPTQKPCELIRPLLEYGCPVGGLVVDPFAGSASTLDAARQTGRRGIGVELHEPYAEKAARRLSQMTLEAT